MTLEYVSLAMTLIGTWIGPPVVNVVLIVSVAVSLPLLAAELGAKVRPISAVVPANRVPVSGVALTQSAWD